MPGIDWFRDLILCIYGVIGIIVLILFAVFVVLVYRKVKVLMGTVQNTTNRVNDIVGTVKEEFISPAVQMMAMIQGIRQIASIFSSFFKKTGEEKNER